MVHVIIFYYLKMNDSNSFNRYQNLLTQNYIIVVIVGYLQILIDHKLLHAALRSIGYITQTVIFA